MRCMNCGWDNLSNTTVCLKCGQPLRMPEPYAGNPGFFAANGGREEAVPKPTVLNARPDEEKCRKTVVFSTAGEEEGRTAATHSPTDCPHCGYPVTGDFDSCPCCGTLLKGRDAADGKAGSTEREDTAPAPEERMHCQECGSEIAVVGSFCPHCGARLHRPTIRRQIRNIAEAEPERMPRCALTILPEEEEGSEVLSKRMEYEGKSIVLNRENTEASNRTITSKEQAEILFDDGHWYLTDRSLLQTTYIQANRRMEIQPGDVIVLGDRRFKFECD